METMDVPCNRCDEFKQRFESAGYRVLGCDPAAAGMCTLRYEDAASPAPAGGPQLNLVETAPAPSAAKSAAKVAAPSATPTPALTPTQAMTAKAIVNLFETGSVLGDYGQVTLLPGDTGRLTYGRSQTTLSSGNLFTLLQRYCDNPGARFAARLRPHLPRLAAQEAALDTDFRLHNLLRACADDRLMREVQDAFFDDTYWQPAQRTARKLGIGSPLGVAVVYDSTVHGSWVTLRNATTAELGEPAAAGERRWIARYVTLRRQWLASHASPILRNTVYRMDAFQRLIDQGWWGLPLPLLVRGQEISFGSLNATPKGCYDGPQPGTRVVALADPLPRGLDVRLLQLGLSDRGMNLVADGVFGQTSAKRITEFQVANGLPATGVADLALMATLTA